MPQREIERIWVAVLGRIREALVSGRPVGFKNVGTIEPYLRASRRAFNPRSREYVEYPPRRYARFVPSRKLRDDLQAPKE